MPVEEKTNSLRSVLENKSTEELKELLALDFSEQEDAEPNVEYIMAILEVIHEREEYTPEQQEQVTAAWNEFQEIIQERNRENTQTETLTDTGTTEKPSLDHSCKSENGQIFRKKRRVLRYCAVAAALAVLLCGSACAIHWNIFQAFANWTAETFAFLTGNEQGGKSIAEGFQFMHTAVAKVTDTPAVPKWAPEGTVQSGEISVVERTNKVIVQATFAAEEKEFTIRIAIHDAMPEDYWSTYQKDEEAVQAYEAGGVTHYIMWNYENASAMWTNGCVEGHIQGGLSVEEVQKMIDSIYKE